MSDYKLENIDNGYNSYKQIIDFYDHYKDDFFQTINVHIENWFGGNMAAVLGSVSDLLMENLNTVNFIIKDTEIRNLLLRNGFLSYYGHNREVDDRHTTIKYLKIKPTDGRFFNNYILSELINRPELPDMSQPLKKKITESIYELYVNAQIHSKTKFIYTCGQIFPAKNKIEFTFVDTGLGFKNVVNSALEPFGSHFNANQAIRWAIKDKNSTKDDVSGGIGLAILIEFIKLNKGKLQIVSDTGFYQLDETGERNYDYPIRFPGAIINISVRTDDDASYSLISEIDNNDLF